MIEDLRCLEEFPYTYESDFSTYDATNGVFHRLAVDKTLFDGMYDSGIIHKRNVVTLENQYDRYYTSNVKTDFSFGIALKGLKGSIFRGKGKMIGTTYSGHPTCTTLCGTLRNLLYHMSSIYHNLDAFSFADEIRDLPTRRFRHHDGTFEEVPNFFELMRVFRKWIKLLLAGDDTAALCRVLQDSFGI